MSGDVHAVRGELVELAPDVFAWLQTPVGRDAPNAGVSPRDG